MLFIISVVTFLFMPVLLLAGRQQRSGKQNLEDSGVLLNSTGRKDQTSSDLCHFHSFL
jgi:hypothetical protein